MGVFSEKIRQIKKGEGGIIGIGILIVFISVVIVAAVAAGVLINTSTALQGQSRDTSRSAMRQVSSGIRVVTMNGYATEMNNLEGENKNIIAVENLDLFVKNRPGSPGINLSRMSIEVTTDDAEVHLTMAENAYSTRDDMFDAAIDNKVLNDNHFAVVKIKNPSETDNYMLQTTSDMAEIWISLSSLEGEDGLKTGESVTVALIPDTGFKTYTKGRAPATMATGGVYKLRL